MKQHITIDQLQELSKKQKAKLYKVIDENNRDFFLKYKFLSTPRLIPINVRIEKDLSYYLNIGKMIEILENNLPTFYINKHLKEGIMKKDYYEVFQQGMGNSCGDTLCDALWKAIKKIL